MSTHQEVESTQCKSKKRCRATPDREHDLCQNTQRLDRVSQQRLLTPVLEPLHLLHNNMSDGDEYENKHAGHGHHFGGGDDDEDDQTIQSDFEVHPGVSDSNDDDAASESRPSRKYDALASPVVGDQSGWNEYRVLAEKTMDGLLRELRTIPSQSIQCILTSPPWNLVGLRTSAGYPKQPRVKYDMCDDNITEDKYKQFQVNILDECHRIIKDDGVILYNHRNRHLNHSLHSPLDFIKQSKCNLHEEIILVHPATVNHGRNIPETHEYVYVLTKGCARPRWNKRADTARQFAGSVWHMQSGREIRRGIDHPCPFDMKIVDILVRCATNEGDVVLDPFAGSGTTLLVAERLKRNFLGFDISDKYYGIWRQRAQAQRAKECAEYNL